ncbi:MAG TPA: DUF177 domain-containing protein [Thermodesulfovibrionales bacterium]|nr:DUF177 domain-containing protein [Thermodesulfovibrionales bacterium]
MKIQIPDIPEEGLEVDLAEDLGIEGVAQVSPARARLSVNKVAAEVMVSGNISVELENTCSRCLKNFRQVRDLPVSVVYHPAAEVGAERHELHDDEMDMGFYRGDELDLQELLREQVMLSQEMKPLCSEGCKGICPKCGKDLNTGPCTCDGRETDPRLEVLKKLLERGKE